jgi:TPP-dependent pyruvate/acetoin dehydrogenase alpha subunit
MVNFRTMASHNHKMQSGADDRRLYREMLRIRRFEERVLDSFPSGLIYGTTHTYIGQEPDAVGVLGQIGPADVVVSNHRCHGHFLAYGGPMEALAAELMGRATGVCGGRGGSQHLQWKAFYANGILGGTVPLAVGMALAEKRQASGRIVTAFLGDGTLGEGVVYESLNMASLWRVPLLFVVENNLYAQSTPIRLNLAGRIAGRFEAFGITAETLEGRDPRLIGARSAAALSAIRAGDGPRALILETYRLAPHSKGDDTRDASELADRRAQDPLAQFGGELDEITRSEVESEVRQEVDAAFAAAAAAPWPDPETLAAAPGQP